MVIAPVCRVVGRRARGVSLCHTPVRPPPLAPIPLVALLVAVILVAIGPPLVIDVVEVVLVVPRDYPGAQPRRAAKPAGVMHAVAQTGPVPPQPGAQVAGNPIDRPRRGRRGHRRPAALARRAKPPRHPLAPAP